MFGGFELLFVVLPAVFLGLIILGLLVVATVFRGAEPDPRGRRPLAVYLLVVMFVALVTALFSAGQIGSVLVRAAVDGDEVATPLPYGQPVPGPSFGPLLPVPGPSPFGGGIVEPPGYEPYGGGITASPPLFGAASRTVADVLEALILALVAGVAYLVHRRWFDDLLAKEDADG